MTTQIPDEMLATRVAALEQALTMMVETFVVHAFDQAWRWDVEEGEPELIEPYANAAIYARSVLDRDDWLERELRLGD
jgi:hypothetical protein